MQLIAKALLTEHPTTASQLSQVQVPSVLMLTHRKKTGFPVFFSMVRDKGLEPLRSPART